MADIQSISTPVVVAGDMNSTDRHEVYTLLTSQLIDAHRAAGWDFGHTYPAFTWYFRKLPIIPRQVRIDMILYSHTRKGHGAENFAILRHIALNLLKQEKTAKIGIQNKRLKAGWDSSYLKKILAGINT